MAGHVRLDTQASADPVQPLRSARQDVASDAFGIVLPSPESEPPAGSRARSAACAVVDESGQSCAGARE